MTEMIERVARAIAESHEPRNWDAMMEHGREWWRKSARAAIEAMREPTERMKRCGGETDVNCGEILALESAADVWRDMIDAALK